MTQPQAQIPLDVHAHLAPVVPERLARIDDVSWDAGKGVMIIDGHVVGMKPLFQPDALLQWMDKNGVAHAWISAPPPLYRQQLRGAQARAWAHYVNDGLRDIAAASDGKFTALMHLPIEDPAVAAEIAGEWIGRGHVLFAMPTGTGDDRTLGDAAFAPLWQALDAAGAFVFFHPGECADGRLQSFYLTNLLGNPYETTVALAHLIFSGVLERHPHITTCFAHGGGLLPTVAGRWDRGHATARPDIDTKRALPSTLMKRIHVDCICHSEAAAELADHTFGSENVVFGSDWPFPMGLIEPQQQLADFSAERRKRYLSENPARLLARFTCKGDK
ncbi:MULTISPECIES: amidohydrolase family protein [unclassified Beijerinckia]|uniref:amidohydrolase family protein n=1 Tax=unclassified Beijerinckia TaxID=2638183 RepID=UPI00089C8D16|nr:MULTISPECIES: amidohydrolase family protein [unclassified Beijerinckia]MDH7799521.1 aminocarboxymuconate-semialdehyde decarboxylase [Beijerinckia sp. GAS462]SEB45810.1 aminocarboxymuconate-semialdehyde decarboxylase [Beijerinckia sp. 28-YEA-48]